MDPHDWLRQGMLSTNTHVHTGICTCTCTCAYKRGVVGYYRITGNFRGRKPSWILRFDSHTCTWKFSPLGLGMSTPTYRDFIFCESFKMITSYWSVKVYSLECLPLYGRIQITHACDGQKNDSTNLATQRRLDMYHQTSPINHTHQHSIY